MNYRKLAQGEEVYLTKMEIYNVAPTGVDLKANAHLAKTIVPFELVIDDYVTGAVGVWLHIIPMWKGLAVLLEEKNQNDPNYDNDDKIRSVYFNSTGETAKVDKTYKLQEAYRILLTLNTSALGLHAGDLIDIGCPQDFPFIGTYVFYSSSLVRYFWGYETFGWPTQFKVIAPNKAIAVCDITIDNYGATSSPDARELFVAEDYGYWQIVESAHGNSTYESNYKPESPLYLPKGINQGLSSSLEQIQMLHKAFWRRNNEVRIGTDGSPMLNPTWDNVRMYAGKTSTEILNALAGMTGTTNIDLLEIAYNNENDGDLRRTEVRNAVSNFVSQQIGICRIVLYEQTYSEFTQGNYDYRYCHGIATIDGWGGTDWQTLYDYWQDYPEMGELPKNVARREWTPNQTYRKVYLPSQGEYVRVVEYYEHNNTVRRMHT